MSDWSSPSAAFPTYLAQQSFSRNGTRFICLPLKMRYSPFGISSDDRSTGFGLPSAIQGLAWEASPLIFRVEDFLRAHFKKVEEVYPSDVADALGLTYEETLGIFDELVKTRKLKPR